MWQVLRLTVWMSPIYQRVPEPVKVFSPRQLQPAFFYSLFCSIDGELFFVFDFFFSETFFFHSRIMSHLYPWSFRASDLAYRCLLYLPFVLSRPCAYLFAHFVLSWHVKRFFSISISQSSLSLSPFTSSFHSLPLLHSIVFRVRAFISAAHSPPL